ncbi:HDIG domain-containing metalloprotein [Clostridium omnivorum]|uniref:HD family phosphohydrolase n=1 Tax=Clostridium omnivorum TaxID=1604902 RepID=A0ABQ5N5S9_9CLOT|nr:HDIG domain-containing metalloprotein [Clostridium sp. E14]GLC30486.1 HD family phosphohydrolase [Clostridium sp. E14]
MSLYRVKQFFWAITAKMSLEDINFIKSYLNSSEVELFNTLTGYEQKHSVNVAMDVKETCRAKNMNSYNMIRVALLHDIGKTQARLNPIEKSIFVIINKLSKGRLKNIKTLKKVEKYYNHGEIGYRILKECGKYDDRFLYLIENHHNKSIVGDKELEILIESDDKN